MTEPEFGAYPRTCSCGEVCECSIEWYVHRTEEHGETQTELDSLQPGEFEEIIRGSETVLDAADELGWSSTRTLRVIGIYGLADLVVGDVELTDLEQVGVDEPSDATQPLHYAGGGSA